MNDEVGAEAIHLASVNVQSPDQPIADQAAKIVRGLREGAYDIVAVDLLSGYHFEVTGLRRQVEAPSGCLHEVVAWRAEMFPNAIAVVAGERRLTYGELDKRAEALAGRLRDLGVTSESSVAVCLPRSAELTVAALAAMKAGGGYVPLDPALPTERLRFILADTGAQVVIAAPAAGPAFGVPVVAVDESGGSVPGIPSSADDLAYIMYTSGSTGTPKGVMIPHRAAVNYLWQMGSRWGLGPGDVVLQLAHCSFSASIRDIFGPLLHGATVEVPTDEQLSSPEYLVGRLTGGVTCVLSCFPSLLRLLLDAWPEQAPATLRLAMIISETFPPGLLADTRRAWGPRVRVVHQYGLTECAMTSLWWTPDDQSPVGARVPVGRPIPNTGACILTDELRPAPAGTVGELYIRGAGLARGYLGDPGRTAERFVPDPFSAAGGRLFRTGDLAVERPDGAFELVGRRDHQVKVRGFRVELGEIEAALREHGQVADAVVVLAGYDSGPRLVAYAVPAEGASLTPSALRGFLAGRLPQYMIPGRHVLLDALPRTTRGKVDRVALAALPHHAPGPDRARAAPRDATERALAAIWCEVLGLDRIGVHDDVFDLGCDSLLLIRALARIRDRVGADIPVQRAFETPTIAGLAGLASAAARKVSCPAPERSGRVPVSPEQRRLWYADRLADGSPLYTVAMSWRLTGTVNTRALQQAVDCLVERHGALRTTFLGEAGQPAAVVRDDLRVAVREDTIPPGADPQAQIDEAARHPFDLRTGPLLRVSLFAGRGMSWLLLTAHHIIVDAHALRILLGELSVAYGQLAAGGRAELPPVAGRRPAQAHDEAALEFWRASLADVPALTGLPTVRPRPAVPGFSGANLRWRMPPELADGLERLARQEGATFFMAALAAWAALLSRWSGQDDLVVAIPVAGRDRVEDEDVIDCLMNLLPIRVDLTGGPSYLTLLGRVKAAVLSALANRDVPFDVLAGQVASGRGGARPLVQVLFDVERELPPLGLAGVRDTRMDVDTGTAKADVSLTLRRGADGLHGCLEYSRTLFDDPTMRMLASQVEVIASAVVQRPYAAVAEISLMGAGELARLAADWDGTSMPYPEQCLHELTARQAGVSPDADAVVGAGSRLTYCQLEARANALAGRLRRLGAGPGVPVGVCIPRSVDQVVAVLAVMKAGGAYVPLDPAHPADRLARLIARSGTKICVAYRDVNLPVPVVDPAEAGEPVRYQPQRSYPDDLAAIYFTSGSSGEPKCVQITHRNWVNRIECMRRDHRLDPGERVLHSTTLSFDDAVVEIFWPLICGGCVAVLAAGEERSPATIAAAVHEHQARYLFLVPSMLALVVAHARRNPRSLRPLRAVFTSGETITPDLVGEYFDVTGEHGPRLYNHWGVTEAGIDSTVHPCDPRDAEGRQVPIGRPLGNVRVYVLDDAQRPVPAGVIGELCVGGAGVSPGYLGMDRLNAERFPADPYTATPGARLYRTGDLARRLPGGELEFCGRRDHQVKVRGNRVELGEVEIALESHQGVRSAVASVRPERNGDQNELVAHLVPAETGLRLEDLRCHLRSRVPGYLIPDAFIVLDTLPTLPSGKVDRTALPDRDGSRPELEAAFVAARTPVEEALAELWREVLGIERVGVHDDFFDLGGHSLRAAILAARIESSFGVPLPLREFLESPTIEGLAGRLSPR